MGAPLMVTEDPLDALCVNPPGNPVTVHVNGDVPPFTEQVWVYDAPSVVGPDVGLQVTVSDPPELPAPMTNWSVLLPATLTLTV